MSPDQAKPAGGPRIRCVTGPEIFLNDSGRIGSDRF